MKNLAAGTVFLLGALLMVSTADGLARPAHPMHVSLCSIVRNPGRFNGRMVQFRARAWVGLETLDMDHPSCEEGIWLVDENRQFVEPPPDFDLKRDEQWTKLRREIAAMAEGEEVWGTFTGRIDGGGRTPEGEKRTFGHMGFYPAQLVLQSVTDVEVTSPCKGPDAANIASDLSKQFPGWRVLQPSDLQADDRGPLSRPRPRPCPGLVPGRFLPGKVKSYGVVAAKKDATGLWEMIVIAEVRVGHITFRVVRPAMLVARASVVSRWPPGTYNLGPNPPQFTSEYDVLMVEEPEAGAVAFVWRKGTFKQFQFRLARGAGSPPFHPK
jgi:hypothetical protein